MRILPYAEALAQAASWIAQGATVTQSYLCSACGREQHFGATNSFVAEARCTSCGKLNDLHAQGCAYSAVIAPLELRLDDPVQEPPDAA